ncbi:NtaA/DmoA family FMN-dependent monooxygenase [Streptomyces parvulus]|uniref:NtaA/DmoA family FMN-dependent monooxygenase n=1 Tax=Streptomyces parvulus TaxID=146923 RepID=UPI003D75F43D
MHLAVLFPGTRGTSVRDDPGAGSQIEFAAFEHLARTAERGLFDFLLLADELRPREHGDHVHDPDAAGGPEPLTVLNALSTVTRHLGLAAEAGTSHTEPFEIARGFATLDHLSGGRAAWSAVASSDAAGDQNFRRGGHLERPEHYVRAAESVAAARQLWDSWTPDGTPRPFAHRGRYFDIAGEFILPRSPQGHPVVMARTGGTDEGREFAASSADVLLTRHRPSDAGGALRTDLGRRLARYGRDPDDLKVMPAATVVLGDTAAEAHERSAEIRRRQVSPRAALRTLERVWGVDLSGYDPDGPLPLVDPVPHPRSGRGPHGDGVATAEKWRALAQERGLSIRQTVIETSARHSFVGTPGEAAAGMESLVARGAADGFVLVPHLVPGGLDEFVDRVVPLLRERGAFRTAYEGATLRSHLGLDAPVWKG